MRLSFPGADDSPQQKQSPMKAVDLQSDGSEITELRLYGERCSGTNFAESLILKNFSGLVSAREFPFEKHTFLAPKFIRPGTLGVVVLRNASTWLKSFHRAKHQVTSWANGLDLSGFIRHEYSAVLDGRVFGRKQRNWGLRRNQEIMLERHPVTGHRIENVVDLRNLKIESHLKVREIFPNFVVVNYEHISADRVGFLELMEKEFSLNRAEATDLIETDLSRDAVARRQGAEHKQDYETFSAEDIEFVSKHLNLQQERAVGYEYDSDFNPVYVA